MDYQPRTIAFHAELLHAPLSPDPRPVQKFHNEMFEGGRPVYASFAVTPVGPILANPGNRPGAVSQVACLADRLQFREELGGLTPEGFAERVQHVATRLASAAGIPLFTGQQVTLRSLVNPRRFRDAREFLKVAMFRFGGETEAFGREPALYGLRLLFPPAADEANAFALRIESYNSDTRSLFVETQGTFGPAPTASDPGSSALGERVLETYRFLLERALPFVARFDVRQEA